MAKAGRPPLERQRIVAAALQLVDRAGADALTMRSLAQQLGSGTATLYRHFADRDDLLAHVVDRIFGEIELDPKRLAKLAWQDACRFLARSMFDVLSRHRGAAKLLIDIVPTGANAMLQRERSIAVLLANGFSPALAARTYATLARYVLGFAIQLVDTPRVAAFPKLDKALFPATFAVAHALPIPLDDEFAFGLELMLDGLSRK